MIPVAFDQPAHAKSYVDQVPLPADTEPPPTLADFVELAGRRARQAQVSRLEALGLGVDGDLERHFGWRVIEALPDVRNHAGD